MSALVSFRAGSPIAAGDIVRVSSSGLITPASAVSIESAVCAGIALNDGGINDLILVNKDSLYVASGGNYNPGSRIYLSFSSGQLYDDYSYFSTALNSSTLSGAYLVDVGLAVSASGISVELSYPILVYR